MHFHNILLQIQYSVTKPIEILHTIADSLQYFDFIIASFNKTIRNSLSKFFTEQQLEDHGLDPILRAENISVEKYVELAKDIKYRDKV